MLPFQHRTKRKKLSMKSFTCSVHKAFGTKWPFAPMKGQPSIRRTSASGLMALQLKKVLPRARVKTNLPEKLSDHWNQVSG